MFKFVKSATNESNWYNHPNYEVAFWGRSNVGKSSLINSIVSNKKMARVSKTPGRTQLINYFENENGAVLVDLPGYGYARVSIEQSKKMMLMVENYLENRKNLKCLYLLIDSRHGVTKNDHIVIEYLLSIEIPFIIVYTKADKLKQKDRANLLKSIKQSQENYGFLKYFIVSSENFSGINELIININENFEGSENEK
ncbi:ribosome biogenesis GTP-binding protein YihA/YsxC [Mycoplasmopsis canis]|uniref:ribosome biogenesis GTP-binding protein YihA/YsxC n=1 Tax=Mycoplasmopsis canis TaxID=29555 RepID=UPI00025ADA2D|nr:ribosome biogenesis GTP-binding protein YihA/YsxC [Mycoplasmopsis canis]EIE40667.1 GTP-binding protein YsxC [Mycoplasmopsis canis UF33]EIE41949.1 GTP-binding protein YsxC [Mycoplasmopsis canis UFG1]